MSAQPEPIHIISLGAGVQSSTMSLMAAKGEITPMPIAAIFADTQAEPQSVYRWLDWLERQLPFPVYRVTKGSLAEDTLRIRQRKDGKGCWCPSGIPYYTVNVDGTLGHGPRQCTQAFKLIPLQRKQKLLKAEHGASKVICWIGISVDEAHRMKESRVRWAENRWPLVEMKFRRSDCLRWMQDHSYPKPPRSACVFCPYHSDAEWRELKEKEPESFLAAARFEKAYQKSKAQTVSAKGFTPHAPYLHAKRIPLDEIDFSTDTENGQLLFGQECEGMCGV